MYSRFPVPSDMDTCAAQRFSTDQGHEEENPERQTTMQGLGQDEKVLVGDRPGYLRSILSTRL